MATLKSNNELKNSQTFHTSPIISDRERIGEYMTRGAIPRLLFKCFIFDVNIPKTDIKYQFSFTIVSQLGKRFSTWPLLLLVDAVLFIRIRRW